MPTIFIIICILIVIVVVLMLVNKYVAMAEPLRSLVNVLIILVGCYLIYLYGFGRH